MGEYHHSVEKETDLEKLSNVPKVLYLVNDEVRIENQAGAWVAQLVE